jgi:hypothetical protein
VLILTPYWGNLRYTTQWSSYRFGQLLFYRYSCHMSPLFFLYRTSTNLKQSLM